jgi:hypothetical protein
MAEFIAALIVIALITVLWTVTSAIETFLGTSNNTVNWGASFNTSRSANLAAPLPALGNFNVSTNYAYGSTGAGTCNQISQGTLTIAASGTNNLLLSAPSGFIDTEGGAAPTFSAIRFIRTELLNTSQGGGANASSVTMGNAGTHPWIGTTNCPFTSTNTVTLFSGQRWGVEDCTSAGGMAVTAGSADQLAIVNNDSVNAATVRVTLYGQK